MVMFWKKGKGVLNKYCSSSPSVAPTIGRENYEDCKENKVDLHNVPNVAVTDVNRTILLLLWKDIWYKYVGWGCFWVFVKCDKMDFRSPW